MIRSDQRLARHASSGVDIFERIAVEERRDKLSGRLLSAQEEERRRIAHELHDNLSRSRRQAQRPVAPISLAAETHNLIRQRP